MKLFSNIYAGIDVDNNRGLIIEQNTLIKDMAFEADSSADFLASVKSLTKQIVAELPFSLRRPKLLVVVSGHEKAEVYREAEDIIYKNSKYRFSELVLTDYDRLIIDAFEKRTKCVYLVTINNRIYGFASFAGWMITKRMFFDGCSSIKWVIEQITDEIPDSIPERIVKINKGRNLEESWNNLEIIISLEPEYYDKMKDIDVTNNYIPDIANLGMKKCIEKFFIKNALKIWCFSAAFGV